MGAILAKCGIDCARCPAFEINSATPEDRQVGAAIWEKYFGLHFKSGVMHCRGCQAIAPWASGNMLPDRACPIRACATHNGANTCAHCLSFPCKEYSRSVPGPGLRQEREAAAGRKIAEREWRKYLEPYDGRTHLANLRNDLPKTDLVPPKPFQPPKAIPFPSRLSTRVRSPRQMRRCHALLSRVFSKTGDTFAEQTLVERELPYLAGLLWAMAFYGRLEDKGLVLKSEDHAGRKECERLVRKADNTPHQRIQSAISSLAQFGLTVGFQRTGRTWTLTMSLEQAAGGSPVLGALQDYARALAERHGPPEYVNGFDLRGQAFKDFKRANMGIFQQHGEGN